MDSNQTLHDFVLNLITNSEARSAFQLDPEGTLNQAGLGDITAADVQDVVPLVVDYTAVDSAPGSVPAVGETDLAGLGTDPNDVIGQLQAVTQQLAIAQPASFDGSVAAAGTVAVDPGNFGVSANAAGGLGFSASPSGVSADLSGTSDVAGTLDSGVVEPVTADPTGAVGATAGSAAGTADGLVGGTADGLVGGVESAPTGVLGTADSLTDGLTSQLDDPTGLVGSLGDAPAPLPDLGLEDDSSPLGGATGAVEETLDGVGVGGLLDGDAGARGSASAGADADADAQAGTGSGLVDDVTDILF